MPRRLLACLFALLAAASAEAAETAAFRGWQAECTDDNICVLVNRATGAAGEDAVIALRRLPDAGAPWQILVTPLDPAIDLTHPFALNVDGGPKLTFNPGYDFLAYGPAGNLFLVNPGLAGRLLGAMAGGMSAALYYEPEAGGSAAAVFALPGLADGLAWIDDRQSRLDRNRRVAAPVDLEPHESMAGLVTPIDGGTGERGLPNNVLTQHYGVHGCERLDSTLMSATQPLTGRLSDSAVLYAIPCTATGQRVDYRLYVVETGEIGGIDTLSFARYSRDYGWTGTDTLVDIAYDPEEGVLTSASPHREVDGCGHYARWRWTDIRFALIEYRYRESCGGAGDPRQYPEVFRLGN
ncbi:DUF1176 domain-containing protein [Microbaculum marinum]|uniref:DUF1176 domain-containing protein n=1 Tax=Microbaculum marinum TaxID=1764581 RepID=A0AAW9RW08_9HYPH